MCVGRREASDAVAEGAADGAPGCQATFGAVLGDREPAPGDSFSFTSRRARFYAAFGPLLVGGTLIVILVVGLPGAWKLLVVPAAIVLGLILCRAVRVALELGYDGVVVRNTFRTYRLRWGEIQGVYIGDGVGMRDCVLLRVSDAKLGIEADATADALGDPTLRRELRRYAAAHEVQLHPALLER